MEDAADFETWSLHVCTALEAEGAAKLLAAELMLRWDGNDEVVQPEPLVSHEWEETGLRWSNVIELLLENRRLSDAASAALVQAFCDAFAVWKPSLEKGTLWFYDCMALRVCSDVGLGRDCANLVMDSCERLVGVRPSEDRDTYDELYRLLSLAADALVVEVFEDERDVLDARVLMGERVIAPDAPTLFGLITLYDYEGFSFVPGRSDVATGANDFDSFIEQRYGWLEPANLRRKDLANRIFDTLNALNPAIEHWKPGQSAYAEGELHGMQRMLDLPWFRLGLAMLGDTHRLTSAVRAYLPALYENIDPDLLHADIRRKHAIAPQAYTPKRRVFDYSKPAAQAIAQPEDMTGEAEAIVWQLPDTIRSLLEKHDPDWQDGGKVTFSGTPVRVRDHA